MYLEPVLCKFNSLPSRCFAVAKPFLGFSWEDLTGPKIKHFVNKWKKKKKKQKNNENWSKYFSHLKQV